MLTIQFTPTKNDYLKSFLAIYLRRWLILLAMLVIIAVLLAAGFCLLLAYVAAVSFIATAYRTW